jgi:hypothetical protein
MRYHEILSEDDDLFSDRPRASTLAHAFRDLAREYQQLEHVGDLENPGMISMMAHYSVSCRNIADTFQRDGMTAGLEHWEQVAMMNQFEKSSRRFVKEKYQIDLVRLYNLYVNQGRDYWYADDDLDESQDDDMFASARPSRLTQIFHDLQQQHEALSHQYHHKGYDLKGVDEERKAAYYQDLAEKFQVDMQEGLQSWYTHAVAFPSLERESIELIKSRGIDLVALVQRYVDADYSPVIDESQDDDLFGRGALLPQLERLLATGQRVEFRHGFFGPEIVTAVNSDCGPGKIRIMQDLADEPDASTVIDPNKYYLEHKHGAWSIEYKGPSGFNEDESDAELFPESPLSGPKVQRLLKMKQPVWIQDLNGNIEPVREFYSYMHNGEPHWLVMVGKSRVERGINMSLFRLTMRPDGWLIQPHRMYN